MRKKITGGIYLIFRGLFFEHNAEIGQKIHLLMGTDYGALVRYPTINFRLAHTTWYFNKIIGSQPRGATNLV
jgi:hypothetical protein